MLPKSQVSQLREVLTSIKRQNASDIQMVMHQDLLTIDTTLFDQYTTITTTTTTITSTFYPDGSRQHTTPSDYTNTSTTAAINAAIPYWL
jgi:hypothetical protein